MAAKKPALPLGYTVEHQEPVTPFGNPWVIRFNGVRVGSAPTKAAALELASEDAKSRKAKPKK
jgi:hypothetical protein